MARLRYTSEPVSRGPWKVGGFPPPPPSIDPSRETFITEERLWWIKDGRMAFRAGDEVYLDLLPLLRSDAEHEALMRGETPKKAPRRRATT